MNNRLEEQLNDRVGKYIAKHLFDHLISKQPGHCAQVTDVKADVMEASCRFLNDELNNGTIEAYVLAAPTKEELAPWEIHATKLVERRNAEERVVAIFIPHDLKTAAEDSFDIATFELISYQMVYAELSKELEQEVLEKLPINEQRNVVDFIKKIKQVWKVPNDLNWCYYYLSVLNGGCTQESFGVSLPHLYLIPDRIILNINYQNRIVENVSIMQNLRTVTKSLQGRVNAIHTSRLDVKQKVLTLMRKYSVSLVFDEWIKETLKSATLLDQLDFSNWEVEELAEDIQTFKVAELKGAALTKGAAGLELKLNSGGVSVKYEVIPAPPHCSGWEKLAVHLVEADATADDYKIVELITAGKKSSVNKSNQSKSLTEKQLSKLAMLQSGTFKLGIQALTAEGIPMQSAVSEQTFHLTTSSDEDEDEQAVQKDKVVPDSSDVWLEDLIEQSMNDKRFQFEPANYHVVMDEHVANKSQIKLTSDVTNNTYSVATNVLLNKLHRLVLEKSEFIGLIKVPSSEVESLPNREAYYSDRPLELLGEIEGLDAFLAARKILFQAILNLGAYHWEMVVSITERTNIRRLVKHYFNSYETLLKHLIGNESEEAQQLLTRLRLLDTIAIVDEHYQTVYLMTPTHPLKLAWQLNYEENAKKWIDYAALLTNKAQEMKKIQQVLGQQSSLNYPFMLKDKFNKWYGNIDIIGRNWGVYVDVTHLSDEYYRLYIQQLFQLEKQSSLKAKLPVVKLKNYILQYLDKHPYLTGLSLNVIEPNDGEEIVQLLKLLYQTFNEDEKYYHFKDLRIQLKMFTKDPLQLQKIGGKVDQLMYLEERKKAHILQERIILSSANSLFPLFSYSKHLLSDLMAQPATYQSHLTIMYQLLEVQFGYVEEDFSKRIRSVYMNGMNFELTTKTSGNSSADDESRWSKFVSTRYELPNEKSQNISELMDIFTRVAMQSERGHEQDLPAIIMMIKPEQKKDLEVIHSNCDWVLLLDEYLGPDFLDRPASGRERYHLIDFVPGEKLTDNNVFISTNRVNEIEAMVRPAIKSLGLAIKREAERGIIDSLNAISGRLALKLNSVSNQMKGAIGMALSRLYIGELNRINSNGRIIILPLDAHASWFKKMESHKMTDLLAILCDPESRTLTFNLIEVKWRSSLTNNSIMDEPALLDTIRQQLENSEALLQQKFVSNDNNEAVKLAQAKELTQLLKYYLSRSERFKSIDSNSYMNLLQFISRLDDEQSYSVTFANHALIFVNSNIQNSSRVLEGVTYHTVGKSYIEKLINGATLEFSNETQIFSDDQLMDRATYFFKKAKAVSSKVSRKPDLDGVTSVDEDAIDNGTDADPFDEMIEQTFVDVEEDIFSDEFGEFDMLEENKFKSEVDEFGEVASDLIDNTSRKNEIDEMDEDPPIFIGSNNPTAQFGVIGENVTNGMKIGIDLNGTNTISLFGVQGSGKSYSIGTVVEMAVKQFKNANKLPAPLASVIFHYSKSETYKPEFTTFNEPNNREEEMNYLQSEYGISVDQINDLVLLTPVDKFELRKRQYPSIDVQPLLFNTAELTVEDWNFLMGTANLGSLYMKQLKQIIRMNRNNLTLDNIRQGIADESMEERSRKLLLQRLSFVEEYVDDSKQIASILKPGRIVIVDIRDEFIEEDEALGLFMVLLRIFSDVEHENQLFNKLIVFDEAHKFMKDDNLMGHVVEVIREMRHKGVSVMIASQNPPSVPKEIIELSNIVLLHKFNAPAWLKHLQKSLTATEHLDAQDLINLNAGEAYVWASKSTHKVFEKKPQKIKLRPRITLHGGATKNANSD